MQTRSPQSFSSNLMVSRLNAVCRAPSTTSRVEYFLRTKHFTPVTNESASAWRGDSLWPICGGDIKNKKTHRITKNTYTRPGGNNVECLFCKVHCIILWTCATGKRYGPIVIGGSGTDETGGATRVAGTRRRMQGWCVRLSIYHQWENYIGLTPCDDFDTHLTQAWDQVLCLCWLHRIGSRLRRNLLSRMDHVEEEKWPINQRWGWVTGVCGMWWYTIYSGTVQLLPHHKLPSRCHNFKLVDLIWHVTWLLFTG